MFRVRRSLGIISNAVLHRFQSLSIKSIHIKAGMEIPDNKPLRFALQYINGIGRSRANQVLAELHMENKLAKDLTKRELVDLGDEVSKYIVGHELNSCVKKDIARLQEIQCHRGIRHGLGLPCRGQRTKTNARTLKSKPINFVGKKKVKNFCMMRVKALETFQVFTKPVGVGYQPKLLNDFMSNIGEYH